MRENFGFGVLWICALLRHEQILAATEAFEVSATEHRWLSAGTLTISESAETQTGELLGTSLDTFEGRIDHQPTEDSKPVGNSVISDAPCPKTEKRAVHKLDFRKGIGVILLMFLCAWFLSSEVKTRTVSKEAESEPPYEAAREDTFTQDGNLAIRGPVSDQSEELRRLQRLRGLLPSASRLAAAVGTNEAQKLLASVQNASNEAARAAECASGSIRLAAGLNSAMEALRALHHDALQQAKTLAQDGADVPVFSLLESEDIDSSMESEIDHILEGESVLPFMVYLRALQQSVIDVSRRFEDARERLLAETEFSDERDEHMLASAALELERLLSLSERKRHTVQRATTLKSCAISGIRIHLKCHVEEWIRTLQGNVELLHAYIGLVSNGIEASSEGINETELAAEDTSNIYTVRRKLAEVKELLSEMRKAKQDVHASTSVGSATAAFKKAEQLMGEAQGLLDDCWDTTKFLPPPNDKLSASDTALLARTAAKARVIADEHNAAIGASLSILYSRCEEALQSKTGTEVGNAKHISSSVAEQLRADAMATEKKAAMHYREVQEAAAQLQRADDVTDAIILLENLEEHIPVFVECNKRAVLLVLESFLQTLLEEDIQASVKTAARAFSSKFTLTGPNKMLFDKLRVHFNRARAAAKKAATLTEAAQAAAKIKMHAEALNDFASDEWSGRIDFP